MPRLSGLLETALYVADLDRSRAFYERVLGFKPMLVDHRMIGLEVPGRAVLLLFRRGGSSQPSETPGGTIPAHDGHGILHVAFAIPLAALDQWEQHFTREGVAVESRVVQAHGGTSLYFRDPDGHSVEVAVPGLWPNY